MADEWAEKHKQHVRAMVDAGRVVIAPWRAEKPVERPEPHPNKRLKATGFRGKKTRRFTGA